MLMELPNSHAIFDDLGSLISEKMGGQFDGMDPFEALEHLDEAAAAAMEGDIKQVLMKNFMNAAADQTDMSPAMKKQLAMIMEDPAKMAETAAKLSEKMGNADNAGEVAMDELFSFANGEMDEFQAKMLENVFSEVVASHIDQYKDRIVVNLVDFLHDAINNGDQEKDSCDCFMDIIRFFGLRVGGAIGFALCLALGSLTLVCTILFTLLTFCTCARYDFFISTFMICALATGILYSAARQCIIALMDPESAGVGFVISLVQQLITSSFVHDFLVFLEKHVAWFHLREFLTTTVEFIFDLVAEQLKSAQLADLIKMMIQEEADELQIQEELEIEQELKEKKKLKEQEGRDDEEDSDEAFSPAELARERRMKARKSKARSHANLLKQEMSRSSVFERKKKDKKKDSEDTSAVQLEVV